MAIWPVIFTKLTAAEMNESVIAHEKIHFSQQKELLLIGFYLLYFFEFLVKLYKTKNRHLAYQSISFEIEAYNNQHNPEYCLKRNHFSWVKFLNNVAEN